MDRRNDRRIIKRRTVAGYQTENLAQRIGICRTAFPTQRTGFFELNQFLNPLYRRACLAREQGKGATGAASLSAPQRRSERVLSGSHFGENVNRGAAFHAERFRERRVVGAQERVGSPFDPHQ